jgi:predicted CoA-substrate-specific enzyme activase
MAVLGLDIGSRTIAAVLFAEGQILKSVVVDGGANPIARAEQLVKQFPTWDRLVATGYGRHAAREGLAQEIITEIKAHALGANYFYPDCRTVLDIGGQDSKVISLGTRGKVVDFIMNDKCAAGTGKFLEVMAERLELPFEELGRFIDLEEGVKINSMCTVFAESEVVSLLAQQIPIAQIAKGLFDSVCDRTIPLVQKVGARERLVFTGGVAAIPGFAGLLERKMRLKTAITVPEQPQIIGALGAALHGWQILKG